MSHPDPDRPALRAAVIVNPIKIDDPEQFRSTVSDSLSSRGFDLPLWLETTVDDAGHAMAKRAVQEGADLVLVAGGDGTVRVVCAELARTGIPIAVLPAGTGNLLARNLGIPLQLDTALHELLEGHNRTIDIVRIDGDDGDGGDLDTDRFTVMAGLGLDAAIIADAPDAMKKRLGWAAYVMSTAKNLNHPSVRVTITVDDQLPMTRRARTVVVGNVGTLQADIALIPDASPDDGMIDVVVLAPRRLSQWPGLMWRVATRNRSTDRRLERLTGKRITVSAAKPMRRQLDGDPIGPGRTVIAEVEPGAIVVRSIAPAEG